MAKQKEKRAGCLICGSKERRLQRGLCPTHHQAFHRSLKKLTGKGREEFEARLIEEGKLLPSRQGQRVEKEDPFKLVADLLISEHPEFYAVSRPLDDPTAEEVLARARQKKKKSE